MPDRSERLAHLFPEGITSAEAFTAPKAKRARRKRAYPERADPAAHVRKLIADLQTVDGDIALLAADRQAALVADCSGVFVDIQFVPNVDFPLASLAVKRKHDPADHIELVVVTELEPDLAQATLFVPAGQLHVLEKKRLPGRLRRSLRPPLYVILNR